MRDMGLMIVVDIQMKENQGHVCKGEGGKEGAKTTCQQHLRFAQTHISSSSFALSSSSGSGWVFNAATFFGILCHFCGSKK